MKKINYTNKKKQMLMYMQKTIYSFEIGGALKIKYIKKKKKKTYELHYYYYKQEKPIF